MVCKDTLRIKHLPKELTDLQKEDFVKHFGAYKVKIITSKAKSKSVVYAKFENEEVAKHVMSRLHQISILNCRLCVEFAETDILQGQLTTQRLVDDRANVDGKLFKNFINKIHSFNDSVGFHQPPPSHLKYNYPKANRPTINNIAHALATVPRFYTQVLHLMNKMNLPPPFAMSEPPVRVVPEGQVVSQKTSNPEIAVTPAQKRKAPSSDESEIESDGESNNRSRDVIPERQVVQKKTVKRPKFIKQPPKVQKEEPTKPAEKAEDVFEMVQVQPQKKIEMKVLQEPEPPKIVEVKKPEEPKIVILESRMLPKPVKIEPTKILETTPKKSTNQLEKPELVVKPEPTPKKPTPEKVTPKRSTPEEVTPKKPTPEKVAPKGLTPEKVTPEIPTLEKPTLERPKTPERKLVEVVDLKEAQNPITSEILISEEKDSKVAITEPPIDQAASSEDEFPCISLEELAANQITDLTVMPVFKNYNAGDPTNKLYIKNCAKTVVVQDLEYIFNRYREEMRAGKPTEFNIRLMKEGRMKGQAFVTLDSVEQAQKAVKETNGFILKDKPLVVVFGKAGKKK